MIDLLLLLGCALTGLFRSRGRLEAEILILRQQINVLRRKSPKRLALSNIDRLLLVWLFRLVPTTLEALTVVRRPGPASGVKLGPPDVSAARPLSRRKRNSKRHSTMSQWCHIRTHAPQQTASLF